MNPTIALALLFTTGWLHAASPELHFCSADEAKQVLTTEDGFTRRLSPFDRAARLASAEPVTTKQYLDFVAAEARPWNDEEKRLLNTAYGSIKESLASYNLPFPETVQLIKTTGAEEAGAAYTRGSAIIFPATRISADTRPLARLLAHELFHVLSRNAPKLRHQLYLDIGFHHCTELVLPPSLKPIRITNPDAPANDHTIQLTYKGQPTWAIPVLTADPPQYDPGRGGPFFAYLQFNFLLVDFDQKTLAVTPKTLDQNTPALVNLSKLGNFHEQVGRNTNYIIHPEEILADNFADIITRKTDVPSPDIQTRLKNTLAKP
ncbi:MAG: DUF4157 domain-containing protein [Verrucomicrobiales bacterium]|nr:DUF4157 domain-containing protein [Verrucomicrobiales bacterium]